MLRDKDEFKLGLIIGAGMLLSLEIVLIMIYGLFTLIQWVF